LFLSQKKFLPRQILLLNERQNGYLIAMQNGSSSKPGYEKTIRGERGICFLDGASPYSALQLGRSTRNSGRGITLFNGNFRVESFPPRDGSIF
jgi:hypothetical protein